MKHNRFKMMASLLACLALSAAAAPAPEGIAVKAAYFADGQTAAASQAAEYAQYRERNTLSPAADRHELAAADAQSEGDCTPDGGTLVIGGEGSLRWKINLRTAALYSIGLEYASARDSYINIECSLRLNGEVPFADMHSVSLPRLWKNNPDDMNGRDFKTDRSGNQLTPDQITDGEMRTVFFEETTARYPTPYLFALKQGENTIDLSFIRGHLRLKAVILRVADDFEAKTYGEYRTKYDAPDYAGETLLIEGESAALKSSSAILPESDRSTPATSPSDPVAIRLNTIGGSCGRPGDWIEWTVTTGQAGWYSLGIKFRQNTVSGMFSSRVLYINGSIPFEEMADLEFGYRGSWQGRMLSDADGNPYRFYFKAGENTVRLRVASGRASELFRQTEESIGALIDAYRQIIMLTSTSPDPLRNYRIDTTLPDVIKTFQTQSAALSSISGRMREIVGKKGSANTILDNLSQQMQSFVAKPITIPSRLEAFQANISALTAWYYDMVWFPLSIDYITLSTPDKGAVPEIQKPDAGFFEKLAYEIQAFIGSFTTDYTGIAGQTGQGGEPLDVWVNQTRFQASIIKKMADASFTPETGIPVNIRIASTGTGVSPLLLATVAGIGPDAAMFMPNGEAVNYASRGAAIDMTRFASYAEVIKRFMPGSLTPYAYQGGGYGLPDMANFQMMYYRRDILDELGLKPPKTWDEMTAVLGKLQKNKLTVGIPPEFNFLAARIYQAGGELYNDDRSLSLLDAPIAMNAFKDWINLYSSYGIPVDFDAANRFRIGEMPIVISTLSFYTHMLYLAPELAGLWDFCAIPGTLREDGGIDNTGIVTGSCSMILSAAKRPEDAWRFLDWWTTKEIQAKNAQQFEILAGSAYRYTTANVEAMKSQPWTKAELETILSVWDDTRGIPEVPGGYYIGRSVDNALRNVLSYGNDAQEVLKDYVLDINREIGIKRREFGLE